MSAEPSAMDALGTAGKDAGATAAATWQIGTLPNLLIRTGFEVTDERPERYLQVVPRLLSSGPVCRYY